MTGVPLRSIRPTVPPLYRSQPPDASPTMTVLSLPGRPSEYFAPWNVPAAGAGMAVRAPSVVGSTIVRPPSAPESQGLPSTTARPAPLPRLDPCATALPVAGSILHRDPSAEPSHTNPPAAAPPSARHVEL